MPLRLEHVTVCVGVGAGYLQWRRIRMNAAAQFPACRNHSGRIVRMMHGWCRRRSAEWRRRRLINIVRTQTCSQLIVSALDQLLRIMQFVDKPS